MSSTEAGAGPNQEDSLMDQVEQEVQPVVAVENSEVVAVENSVEQEPQTISTQTDQHQLTLEFQLFPHSDTPLHRQDHNRPFLFSPVEKKIKKGSVIHIGRKIDRTKDGVTVRGTTREDRAMHNVSVDPNHMSTSDKDKDGTLVKHDLPPDMECIAFRSKVVSRHHAELSIAEDGQLYFRDVGSSSGSFLNRLRLSASGKESRLFPLKSGDIIQLGVDYQGRQEEIYKAVMIKIFINSKRNAPVLASKQRLNRALRSLLHAMNPNSKKEDEPTHVECCICINSMSPFQALFLAPCSHCFHYKCVTTLLGAGFMFQCPLCRQVANLEASVAEPDDVNEMDYEEEEIESTNDVEMEDAGAPTVIVKKESNNSARVNVNATLARHEEPCLSDEDHVEPLDPTPAVASSSSAGKRTSIAVNIPAANRALQISDTMVSPSTPQNTSHLPMRHSPTSSQPRRPDIPVQIFNTLNKMADGLSREDGNLVNNSIEEYGDLMKNLLRGLGGSEEEQQALLNRIISSLAHTDQ